MNVDHQKALMKQQAEFLKAAEWLGMTEAERQEAVQALEDSGALCEKLEEDLNNV